MSLAAEIATPAPEPKTGLSLEGLLRQSAASHGEAVALADASEPQRAVGTPRSLTYAEADRSVDALASVFVALGLLPGDRIAIQLPNSSIAPLAMLAGWRAGLTVLALPYLWRRFEIAQVAAGLKPSALVGGGAFDGVSIPHGLCEVAAKELSVRFVLGFGPDLPDGVAPLNGLLDLARSAVPATKARGLVGPALVTFTARAGAALQPVVHTEDELLVHGMEATSALSLDRSDAILNPFPLSSAAGLSFAFLPWLVSGCTLLQHQPFDPDRFAAQIIANGATITALPASLLAPNGSGVLLDPRCKLRLLGAVWSPATFGGSEPAAHGFGIPLFDLFPAGDSIATPLLRGSMQDRLRLDRDPELLHHGGFAIAASELDQLYRSYPGFLDAACFAVPCPLMGDRILAAVVAKPAQSISRDALCAFLAREGVAPYKYPERLVVVKSIPRDEHGRVIREELAAQATSVILA
jgi:acyl-CoA synthetase (AMP-forming)/AMP-acid ligase II